jgi:putative flippase GtrA
MFACLKSLRAAAAAAAAAATVGIISNYLTDDVYTFWVQIERERERERKREEREMQKVR